MRTVLLIASTLVSLAMLTFSAFAQATTLIGDRYESYTAQKQCTALNCNLSFPQFVLPAGVTGFLLVEDISCGISSETTVFASRFGPTGIPEDYIGNKRATFLYNSYPYNSFSRKYESAFHATPNMMMAPSRYMTVNFFINQGASNIFYSYVNCSLSGRIVR